MLASGGNTNFLGSPRTAYTRTRGRRERDGLQALCAGATPLAKLLWIGWAKGSKGHPRLRGATQSWRKNRQILRGLMCDPFGPCGRNADVISGTNCCPLDITMRARSMAFLAPSLVMILARWHSIVRGLIPEIPCGFLV